MQENNMAACRAIVPVFKRSMKIVISRNMEGIIWKLESYLRIIHGVERTIPPDAINYVFL